jgi:hypothetical protein
MAIRWRCPTAELNTAFAHASLVSFRESIDELLAMSAPCGIVNLFFCGRRTSVRDILPDRSAKEQHLLRNHRDISTYLRQIELRRRQPIKSNYAFVRFVKAKEKTDHRALARSAGTNQRDSFAWIRLQR